MSDIAALQGVTYVHKQWGGRTPKTGGQMFEGRIWRKLPMQSKPMVTRTRCGEQLELSVLMG